MSWKRMCARSRAFEASERSMAVSISGVVCRAEDILSFSKPEEQTGDGALTRGSSQKMREENEMN